MFYFNSKLDFYTWIADRFPLFDLNASLWVSGFGYQLKNQPAKYLPNLQWMLDSLNKDLQSEFDQYQSYMMGGNYVITMLGDKQVPDIPALVKGVKVVVDEPETSEVDWLHAESLNDESDKSGSKDALESYAKQFSIDLKKNKTFVNMMKDFRKFMDK